MKSLFAFALLSLLVLSAPPRIEAQNIPERIQRAASLLSEGKLDDAVAILNEVIQQDARHGPAQFLLGQIAMEQHRWKDAEEHLNIAVSSHVRRPHLAWHLLGKVQLLQHRYAEAIKAFDESLRELPAFVPALIGRSQAKLFSGDTTSTGTDLQVAAAKSSEGAILFAELLIYTKQEKEAVQTLNSPVLQNSTLSTAAKTLELAITSDPEEEKQLRSLLSENLGDPQSYLALAIWEQRNRQTNNYLFEIAFQLDDQNPMPLLFLKKGGSAEPVNIPRIPYPEIAAKISAANSAFQAGQWKEATEFARQILPDRPMHVPALLIAIEASEKQQDMWGALKGYSEIVQRLAGIPSVEYRLASLAQKMEAHDLAECRVRKAIEIEPGNASQHHLLATILKSKNKIDAALKETELAISFGLKTAAVYETLGNLYYENMEISKSIAALRKTVELDPHATGSIASFAVAALTSEDHESLQKLLEIHAGANPENISTLYSLSLIYMNENRLEQAETCLTQLEKLAPEQQQIHYNLALVKFRLGKTEEGQKSMKRFQEIKEEQRREFEKHVQAFKLRLTAQQAFRNNRMEESIRLYSQLYAENRAETADLIALAKSYSDLKKHEAALRIYEAVLRSSPYNTEGLAGASEAAQAAGITDRAKMYNERLELMTRKC